MTAVFVAIFLEQRRKEKRHTSAFVGLGLPLLCLLAFGSADFILPSMLAILVVLTALLVQLVF